MKVPLKPSTVDEILTRLTSIAIKDLLEQKHLYQSVKIGLVLFDGFIESCAEDPSQPWKKSVHDTNIICTLNKPWCFVPERLITPTLQSQLKTNMRAQNFWTVNAPVITLTCDLCGSQPHHFSFENINENFFSTGFNLWATPNKHEIKTCKGSVLDNVSIVQDFMLPYQCQRCLGEPVFFFLRRENDSLQLTGRSKIKKIDTPKFIPDEERKYFREAAIANSAGKPLAAYIYLRTFVEQYLRRVLSAGDTKMRGDELGVEYAKRLDKEFPQKCNTLKGAYEELSVAIHTVNEDHDFEKTLRDVLLHFQQLEIIPLPPSS